jgi:hypothetical protein
MKKSFLVCLLIISGSTILFAQQKAPVAKPTPAAAPTAFVDKGRVEGKTYTNNALHFSITFPFTWLIPDDDFEAYMKKQGFDLSLRAPDSLTPADRSQIDQTLKKVQMLVTAYRSIPGSDKNAIMRVSVEDLKTNPQIKDAVDYFDAIRSSFKAMRLPPDFKYSDTQAEKLGEKQFAFLDVTSTAGKKRMYATVDHGFAIMFTLTYSLDEDLETMRQVLADGDFKLNNPTH